MKAREHNSPIIQNLIDETTPEQMERLNLEMTNQALQTSLNFYRENIHALVSNGGTQYTTEKEIYQAAKELFKQEISNAYLNGMVG